MSQNACLIHKTDIFTHVCTHTHTPSILTEQILPQLPFCLIIPTIKMVTFGHGCPRLIPNIHLSDQRFWLFPSYVLQEEPPSSWLLYVLSHSLRLFLLLVPMLCADRPVLCCMEKRAAILWNADPSLLRYAPLNEERLREQVDDQGLPSPSHHQPEERNAVFTVFTVIDNTLHCKQKRLYTDKRQQ